MGKSKRKPTAGRFRKLEVELDKHRINHTYDKTSNSLNISRPFGVITVNVPKTDNREFYYVTFNVRTDKFFVHTSEHDKLERMCISWDEYDKWNNNKNKIIE